MATVTKRGNSYKITVSCGYDLNGKQIRQHMTWTPAPGMTARQIEKELERQKVLFEEQVKCTTTHDGNIRLKEFTDKFLKDYAYQNLKAKTAFGYEKRMEVINQAIGHIKLKDLKPGHIASFYSNLQEEGMRARELATIKIDFSKWLKEHNMTMAAMAEKTGVSLWVFKKLKNGESIARDCTKPIAEVMGMEVNQLFTPKKDMTPLAAGTIHTFHRVLSAVLFRAVKWGYIQSNPAARADLPSIANRRAAYLDEPDARRLLELLKDEPIKWRTIVTFDLLSGLRRGELAGLRWQDVNSEEQTIIIRQTSNYLPGKGVYVDTPKTTTSNRPLKLSRSAFLLLMEYKRWQDDQRDALGDAWKDKDGRIFTTDDGAPMFPDSITQWFSKFVKRTGLPKVTVHSLRHTYASLMISDGVPLVVVSHQLGHAQTSTTANIYAHVIVSAEARAAQTFDKFNDIIVQEEAPKKPTESRRKIRKIG
ncbi:site-specific integrase [Ruminiclostridium josui]|uniref:site-specific integrase n=1 Tax=Ruminiclostridium josui TaxID=1499 RepID=UPI0004633A95|nr:site-specific integrase [Ruminiclostridium josui]